MPTPFSVRDQDDPGVDLGEWTEGGDIRIPGTLTASNVETDAGATITGNTDIIGDLVIKNAAQATKAYRLRTSGNDLDLDAAGDPLIISVFTGADFSGTQRTYIWLENGSQTARVTGTWQWTVTNPFATAVHSINPTTGVASFGGKNGLTTINLCGFKATAGAPATGTWAVGDVVLATDGWFLCSVAGTPGTWGAV